MYKLILLLLFIFSCIPVKQSYRYEYYNKTIDNNNEDSFSSSKSSLSSEETRTNKVEIKSEDASSFIENWLGVPYQYGGITSNGIDCSALTQKFYKRIYNQEIDRTSIDQFRAGKVIRKSELTFGDLVFFQNVRSNASIDHVGIYIGDSKFLHASTSNGVMISSLEDTYFKPRFVAARRLRN